MQVNTKRLATAPPSDVPSLCFRTRFPGMRIASELAAASLGAVARSQQDVYIEAFSSLLVYLPDKGSWWPNRNP